MNDDGEMEDPEVAKYIDAIEESLEQIKTREDLVEFAALLKEGYDKGAYEFTSMSDFLEAFTDYLDGLPWLCKNLGRPEPTQPDWRWVGEIIVGALVQ